MKVALFVALLMATTQLGKAVGNEVVEDMEVLAQVGFKFEKSTIWSTDKTFGFTAFLPPFYTSGYGEKPFFSAAYIRPESPELSGPKLISAKGTRMPLAHRAEKAGYSISIQILRREASGAYLEVTYNQGAGNPPMLVHIPIEAIVENLSRPEGAEQAVPPKSGRAGG